MSIQVENGKLANGSIVSKAWKTTLNKGTDIEESIKMNMEIDLSGMTVDALVEKTLSSLIITRQAQERKITIETLEKINNGVVHYSNMGKTIVDPVKAKEDLFASIDSMPEEIRNELLARYGK